ncbi:MAG TPA: rRNA maturation RNase YbeY [Ignavibacteriaceae bacterium]|nr:rRNA maturation RNase YbeY [Ignavibacteriaceae bacterium]
MVKNLQVYSQDSSINKKTVHKLISSLRKEFNLSISFLSISFVSSSELRDINKEYLNHDYETDIITFNYSKKLQDIDGEILISFEEARRNAKKYDVTYGKELCRLVIHGMLHLLNFDDNNKENKKIMKRMENKLILSYNFTLFACK